MPATLPRRRWEEEEGCRQGRHPSPICAPALPTCHCGRLRLTWLLAQYLSYSTLLPSQSQEESGTNEYGIPGRFTRRHLFPVTRVAVVHYFKRGRRRPIARTPRAQDAGRGDLCLRSLVVPGHARPRLRPRLAPCRQPRRLLLLLLLRAPGCPRRRRRAAVAAPPRSRRLPAPASVAAAR